MQVRIVKESEVARSLDAAIRRGLCICFPQDKDVFSKTRKWHGSGPVYSVFVQEGDNVIAHVGMVDRVIKVGDKEYRIAGVQNMFVIPEYRGTGLSNAVLSSAMEEAKRQGFDYGLLFTTEYTKEVYARNGWVQITGRKFIAFDDGEEIGALEEVKMYCSLTGRDFPPGTVNLQGNDW